MPLIAYDHANMLQKAVGRYGAGARELKDARHDLERAKRALIADWKQGRQGWLGCPDDAGLVRRIRAVAKEKRRFTTCLVIGIGGSDLGARAAWHALKQDTRGMRLEFAGGNTDPDGLAETLGRLDLNKTLVNIISKSGDTIEPMSAFLIVRDKLIRKLGKNRFAEHIVATTDAQCGSLRALASKEGYATLPVPENIGGRFSVLTAVGLFPLACAGIDIGSMLSGAKNIRNDFVSRPTTANAATAYAAFHARGDRKRGHRIHVLMPYSEHLREFAFWYRQLWAESLGKKRNREGDIVNAGPTPVAALGATDQHSQIQLYTEGPNDKITTFIDVGTFNRDIRVPPGAKIIPPLAYLSGASLQSVIHAERKATAEALRQAHRPNGTLRIPAVDAPALGALFMFFQIAAGMMGELYDVNAYDQPGVESGKRVMTDLLKRGKTRTNR